MHVTSPENRYSIECTTGSIILLLMYCPLPIHNKYYIMNPIRRHFSCIGMIEVGVHGLLTRIPNIRDHKYGWIVVHHEDKGYGSKLFMYRNVKRDCSQIDGVDFTLRMRAAWSCD